VRQPLPLRSPPWAVGDDRRAEGTVRLVKAQCQWEAELDKAERLATGEPFTVRRWKFGGHNIPREDGWPAWLRDHFEGVRWVLVFCDDTVAPCSEHPCHHPPARTTSGPSSVRGLFGAEGAL
jgi:hypothetical protein